MSPASIATTAVAFAFAIGVAFGVAAQATRVCTKVALTDVRTFGDTTRLRMWLVLLALMTLRGAVTALAFTIYQGISGLSTLGLGSFGAVKGIVGGALAAIRFRERRIERSGTNRQEST